MQTESMLVSRKNENSVKIIKLFLYLQLIKKTEKRTTAFQSLSSTSIKQGLNMQ